MPVKWTPETDQILLLKILETSNVSPDAKAISATWPKTHETPTPRAITERIHRIRTMTKSASTPSTKSDVSPRPMKSVRSPRKKRKQPDAKTNDQFVKSEPQKSDDDLYGEHSTPTKKAKSGANMESSSLLNGMD